MVTLKRAGKLENLAGLLAGGFSRMGQGNPPFGKSAETIIRDAVADYDYPVAFGFPAGHFPENYPLVIGRQITLSVDEHEVVVTG
jgi:muramoyltetrapeptide carboxypeptidase